MADRKAFLLRIDQDVLDAIQRWANDDLRSVNGQIEFLLRRALQDATRPVAGGSGTPAARGPAGRAADGDPRER